MVDKSTAEDFFFKRILTKVSNISLPGYITSSFPTVEGQTAFERIVMIPESFYILLEKLAYKKNGAEGQKHLYAIGKQFGYRFAGLLRVSKSDTFVSAVTIFKFLATLYAEKIDVITADGKTKTLILDTKNLAITAKTGGGYILTIGGCAGVWAYINSDYTLECCAKHVKRDIYKLITAPLAKLKSENMSNIIISDDKSSVQIEVDTASYKKYNSTIQQNKDHYNITKLIEQGTIKYVNGSLSFSKLGTRLLSTEISLISAIETYLEEDLVFDASYDCFYELGGSLEKLENPYLFVSELLTALGFGIVTVIFEGRALLLNFSGYPWISKNNLHTGFNIIQGFVSGFIEGNQKIKVKTKEYSSQISDEKFVVTLKVK